MSKQVTRNDIEKWCKDNNISCQYNGKDKKMYISGKDAEKKIRHNFLILRAPFAVVVR